MAYCGGSQGCKEPWEGTPEGVQGASFVVGTPPVATHRLEFITTDMKPTATVSEEFACMDELIFVGV